MDYAMLSEYLYIIGVTFCFTMFIAYIVHLYRLKATTGKDIEETGKMVLNDNDVSTPFESKPKE